MTGIYVLPYAGGGASSYRAYGERFPATVGTIVPIEIPGRGKRSREAFAESFADCVERSCSQLPATKDNYILHGHCMGALLAFEMLKLVEDRRLPLPGCLVVSGRNAPHHPNRWAQRVSGLDDRAFFGELHAVGGVPAGLNFAMARDFLAIIRADQRMGAGYKPGAGRISVPILVLAGEQDDMTNAAALQEWQDYTTASIDTRWLPGKHYFVLDQPDRVAGCIAAFRATIGGQPASAG